MTERTPTERMVIELATQVERYRFALHGCLVGARNGRANADEAQYSLKFIEDRAHGALYGEEKEEME